MASKVLSYGNQRFIFFIHNIIYKYTLILDLLNDIIIIEKYYPKQCR
jgi:hypothetical protein